MNLKNWSWAFAIVFIVVGILGFIPSIVAGGLLFNTFVLGRGLSLVFLASGILAALAAMSSLETERLYFKTFGIAFLLLALIGFVQGTTVLGLFGINLASSALSVVAAAIALYLGFGSAMKNEERMVTHKMSHI